MIEVTFYKVLHNGRLYRPPEVISNMSAEDEDQQIAKGYAVRVEDTPAEPTGGSDKTPPSSPKKKRRG